MHKPSSLIAAFALALLCGVSCGGGPLAGTVPSLVPAPAELTRNGDVTR